jgi:hypothetical protein
LLLSQLQARDAASAAIRDFEARQQQIDDADGTDENMEDDAWDEEVKHSTANAYLIACQCDSSKFTLSFTPSSHTFVA